MSDAPLSTSRTLLPTPRRRWRSLLLALVIFFCGIIAGGAATVVVIAHRIHTVIRSPEALPERLTTRISQHLGLTSAERERVSTVLEQHQVRLLSIRREVQPRVMTELDAMRADIAAAIDPSRREKWNATYESFVDNWLPPTPASVLPSTQP